MPRIIPCRRWSNGVAASSTMSSVAAAPDARNPDPSQGSSASELASSADTTITRRQRPARIQSSASVVACVVLAHAALTCVLGPRAPMISANCEWPIARQRKMNRRSNTYGSDSQGVTQLVDAPVGLHRGGFVTAHPGAHRFQGKQLLAVAPVDVVALEVSGEVVVTGKRGGEDDAGVVTHRIRQSPPVGQLGAQRCGLVVHDQRDPGVTQGVEARTDCQLGGRVQRGVAGGVDRELGHHVQRCAAPGQFDDVRLVVDRLERGVAGRALDQAGDVPVEHRPAQPVRNGVDELLTVEDPGDVLVVEDPLDAGQPERCAGYHHRFGSRRAARRCRTRHPCRVRRHRRPGGPIRRTARWSSRSSRSAPRFAERSPRPRCRRPRPAAG